MRVLAVAAGLVAVLAIGQPAHAYVRRSGTGTQAQTVTTGQALTVSGTTAVFGSSAKTSDPPVGVTATVSNPNPYHRWVHTVTITFRSSSKSGCGSADYQLNGSPEAVGLTVAGTRTLAVTGLSVGLVTSGCKGSTVTLTYSVS